MIGGLMGDYAGSRYEHTELKGYNLPLWGAGHRTTDDTILMTATMDALMNKLSFADAYRKWFKKYPNEGYSPAFSFWASYDDEPPYDSRGNGAAVRATPIGFFAKTEEQVLALAKESTVCTHNTQEAIEGAQAVALSVFYAKNKDFQGRRKIALRFKELIGDKELDLDALFISYNPKFVCSETVPQALHIGFHSRSFEDAMRRGTYIGGDTDTQMAIAGVIAQARGLPISYKLLGHTVRHLNESGMNDLLHLVMEFESKCNIHYSLQEAQKLSKKMAN